MHTEERNRLDSFLDKDRAIIQERLEWYLIRLKYLKPVNRHFLKYISMSKMNLYNYVRINYLLGEPL